MQTEIVLGIVAVSCIVTNVMVVSVLGYVSDTNKKINSAVKNQLDRITNIAITQLEQHYEQLEKEQK